MPTLKPKPWCIHCGKGRKFLRRNLCSRCYRNPEIFGKYPPLKYPPTREERLAHRRKYIEGYYEANKTKIRAYCLARYRHTVNTETLEAKERRVAMKRETMKKWRQENRDSYNARKRADHARLIKTNPVYKITKRVRTRLFLAIRKVKNPGLRNGSAVRDLGCTIPEFMSYIAAKFQPGMAWDNWGRDTWHLDHIKPLASFDLTKRQQVLKACHYTNYQPLWAFDNLVKNKRSA